MYYVVAIASIALGWCFNIRFVRDYSTGSANAIWGPGSWSDYIRLMFTNPAASSASQDYTIANVVLLQLFTIVDGYRRGQRRPWLYFVSSLFTVFAFAFAFYFATVERQRRHAQCRWSSVTAIGSDFPVSYQPEVGNALQGLGLVAPQCLLAIHDSTVSAQTSTRSSSCTKSVGPRNGEAGGTTNAYPGAQVASMS